VDRVPHCPLTNSIQFRLTAYFFIRRKKFGVSCSRSARKPGSRTSTGRMPSRNPTRRVRLARAAPETRGQTITGASAAETLRRLLLSTLSKAGAIDSTGSFHSSIRSKSGKAARRRAFFAAANPETTPESISGEPAPAASPVRREVLLRLENFAL
jgi:hypothetical protein